MSINANQVRRHLQQFDFQSLFVEELGWDIYDADLPVTIEEATYTLHAVAEKRGMVVFHLPAQDEIPPADVRNKIERRVAQSHREHFIIFTDGAQTEQKWLWVKREPGRPLARRTHEYRPRQQAGDSLMQKLEAIAFSFAEEEDLTLVDVTSRVRAAFNVERATKKFYDRFKKERDSFETFVQGIDDADISKWYVSVMLNRLMFIYFLQRKGFLDGDRDYLHNRLRLMQEQYGDKPFYSFYRYFLLRLFHEGLGEPHHDPELERLVGRVPYLNGGIFQLHLVEQIYPDIQISDEAFERIFDFFDQYQWYLDDRLLHDDREINPDVLGYIFEKYINQKQMGAYYTKEDITEYISKNTIIPFLFDQAQKDCAIAFTGERAVWGLAQADPDRYIYAAVRQGTELPLPEEIAAGLEDVSRREKWNTRTPEEYALPTEIWRETVARRQRYEDIRLKLAEGEVTSINDFITYNLDIQQFAQDVIENSEGPELLRAFWKALNRLSALDPTCGSGAFLFAALNILQPLYEACLERMRAFVADLGPNDHPQKFSDFKRILAQVDQHPNQTYYVLKSIVVNNLYGVDIMAEAVEIAKLRLFLKLVAQVETVEQIEPLPDIDFNIRTGNTLVGFTSKEEVAQALQATQAGQGRLLFGEDQAALAVIEEKAGDVDRLFSKFREMQTSGDLQEFDAADFAATKQRLQDRLRKLETELNRLLARQYGVNPDDEPAYQQWLSSHQPFHWFTEFYGILKQGGFDAIVGNPPWVEYRKVNNEYALIEFETIKCNNLWAFVTEKSIKLLNREGFAGLIVPMALTSSARMLPIQELLIDNGNFWVSNIESDTNPGRLFDGVKQNVSILFFKLTNLSKGYTSSLHRFFNEARNNIFPTLEFVNTNHRYLNYGIPKIANQKEQTIFNKLFSHPPLALQISKTSNNPIYVHRISHYYIKCFDFVPYFRSDRDGVKKSEDYKVYHFKFSPKTFVSIINSSLFYFYWQALFDGFKAGKEAVEQFPCKVIEDENMHMALENLCDLLMNDMKENSTRLKARYARTGNVEYDQFLPRKSKHIMDEIDRVLAQHYGFTDEELDFIINYDIKYRMGNDLFAEEGEA